MSKLTLEWFECGTKQFNKTAMYYSDNLELVDMNTINYVVNTDDENKFKRRKKKWTKENNIWSKKGEKKEMSTTKPWNDDPLMIFSRMPWVVVGRKM